VNSKPVYAGRKDVEVVMKKSPRLEDKILVEIQLWYDTRGTDFTVSIKEFCQGNRASLTQILAMVEELSARVFVGDGSFLNKELQEDLEYRIFDLIGKFSSTPGEQELLEAIRNNIVTYLTEIFAETKKQWNLNKYKITESYEEIDPLNSLIPDPASIFDDDYVPVTEVSSQDARREAREILDELVVFAKQRFRGEVKRKIAINWLENPEKRKDFQWLAALVGTSVGSTKVILTRIKHSFAKAYTLKKADNKLVLVHAKEP
jgi:hypothetical protein